LRKGLPATASISAVPLAVATSNAARSFFFRVIYSLLIIKEVP
jgi:hypothetical protein